MREAPDHDEAERDQSLPPPVAETGRRSVGNRKERQNVATMRVPRMTRRLLRLRHTSKEYLHKHQLVTRCAGPRRTGEDFDSLPFALLDLPYPSPDDHGLTIRGTRIVAMYHRSLRFPTLRLADCVHRTRSATVPWTRGCIASFAFCSIGCA